MSKEEAAPYEVMAEVYDRWMQYDGAPYEQWCGFIDAACRRHDAQVKTILEIGCGTGSMTAILAHHGYQVTSVDGSKAMLQKAREKLGPTASLVQANLGGSDTPDLGSHDAAICCFDVVNYFTEEGQLARALAQIRSGLRAGALLIFDANSQFKMERLFGDRTFGGDFGDFAYIQRCHYDVASRCCELLLTFFLREGGLFRRVTERHLQRWFTDEEMNAALAASGFEVLRVCDGYTDVDRSPGTARATWVVRA
ncbi:MAG TPA: class I SAM-dependent methyltransferase [Acidimicrobiales bacterium]|nr:class I SAM-dependent methyltransferase [Acidimicrobiales bacterium]